MGDSEGEETREDGQEEEMCMDEDEGEMMEMEGEMMEEMAEDDERFPDSNLDDDGNEFAEVRKRQEYDNFPKCVVIDSYQ